MDQCTKYAKEVVAGNIVAGELVIKACKRHLNDLKRAKTKKFRYKFDTELAERSIQFFSFLQHSKGKWAGTPIELQLWQCFTQGCVFGWVSKDTGLRKYRIAYEQVARKNGKSTKLGGVGLYGLAGDGEQGAEVYSAATKRDQAKIIFDEAKNMVVKSPSLKRVIDVFANNLSVPMTNSKFEPLAADSKSLDGLNVSMGLIDELHAHKTREVYDVIETATGARSQPLIYIITTAGFNRNGICFELYDYAVAVLNGTIEDEAFFAYIAQIDPEDDWRDPACWIKANPNLGVSVGLEDLEIKARKAMEIPAAQNNFMCKHLNVWVNADTKWMNMEKWKNCPEEKFEEEQLVKLPCYVGMDLSTTTDITSLNFEFPLGDGRYYVESHSFLPEDAIEEKERRDNVPYSAWARMGLLTLTPGEVVDYEWIKSLIYEKAKIYDIKEICYDPWNATQIANDLDAEGFLMVEIRQGFRTLSEPTKDLEKLIIGGKLIHNNNPLLTFAVGNAVAVSDPAGNIKLDKSKTQFRIDPCIAMVTSHVRAMFGRPTMDLNAHIMSEGFSL